MRKVLFGIFAHPDDEAFGPCGTLILHAQNDWELHIIIATSGEAGRNGNNQIDLGALRRAESQKSGLIIGAREVHFLPFADGKLNNDVYLNLVTTLHETIQPILQRGGHPEIVRFVTFEYRGGYTGHVDHIVVSLATTYLYRKLCKEALWKLDDLYYYCLRYDQYPTDGHEYFVYMPPGYAHGEIDETIDVESVLNQKIDAIKAHASQKHDMEKLLSMSDRLLSTECFLKYKA